MQNVPVGAKHCLIKAEFALVVLMAISDIHLIWCYILKKRNLGITSMTVILASIDSCGMISKKFIFKLYLFTRLSFKPML